MGKNATAPYALVLFDLDGTLTESGRGITHCAAECIRHFGYEVPPIEVLRTFIGPPLATSFLNTCHMTQQDCDAAIVYYHDLYLKFGYEMNALYPDAKEILSHLRAQGILTGLATSKAQLQAESVAEYFGLTGLLDVISGARSEDQSAARKQPIIQYALDQLKIEPTRAVMVGDTKYDAEGAADCGTDFIGVLHGYGTQEEMEKFGGRRFVPDLKALEALLIGE